MFMWCVCLCGAYVYVVPISLLCCSYFATNVYKYVYVHTYNVPLSSVVACACNRDGSNGTTCHQVTGQCECLPNVVGLKCDRCAADTYDFGSDSGCTPCNCHPMGAMSQQCNASNGQCECQPGVTGRTCNQCQSAFFGFSSSGCQGTVA